MILKKEKKLNLHLNASSRYNYTNPEDHRHESHGNNGSNYTSPGLQSQTPFIRTYIFFSQKVSPALLTIKQTSPVQAQRVFFWRATQIRPKSLSHYQRHRQDYYSSATVKLSHSEWADSFAPTSSHFFHPAIPIQASHHLRHRDTSSSTLHSPTAPIFLLSSPTLFTQTRQPWCLS